MGRTQDQGVYGQRQKKLGIGTQGFMLQDIIHSAVGWFHFIVSLSALLFGTLVLFKRKGTKNHKIMGYVYVVSMVLLNVSSFFIVNFGGFSLFHFFAIVSLITVLGGFIPALLRIHNWFAFHFYFMSWSVVGLYAALWSEIGTRFVGNMQEFWWAVALATGITVIIGARVINREAKKLKLK